MKYFASLLFAFTSLALAQPQTVTTTATQTITGQKTFSGSDKLCLKEPSGTDKICFNAPALGSATISLTTPAVTGTLATLADLAASGVTSLTAGNTSLTISPTTGASVATLNVGNANTWTGQQTFNTAAPIFGTMSENSVLYAGSGGVLSQSNSTFHWVPGDGSLKLGTSSTTQNTYPLHAYKSVAGLSGIYIENPNAGATAETVLRLVNATGTGAVFSKFGTGFSAGGCTGCVAQGARLANYTGPLEVGTIDSQNLYLSTNGTVRATVEADGDVTIGSTWAWDAANARLNLGTATTTANRDVYLQKTVAGIVRFYVNNLSNGTTAQGGYTILNDAGTAAVSMLTTSSGFTTAGLIAAGDSYISNVGGKVLIAAGSASQPVVLAAGGTGTANEGLRIVSGMAVTKGYTVATLPAGTTGAIAHVTDQLTTCPAKGAAPTGGGAVTCLLFYDGSGWKGA